MSSASDSMGSFIGGIIVILAIGWFGISNYIDTRDENLPIKIKQSLYIFQKTLPIEIKPGLILEEFNFSRTTLVFTLKMQNVSENMLLDPLLKGRYENRTLLWLCEWRKQFLRKNKIKISITILNKVGVIITNVKNTYEDCDKAIPSSPNEFVSGIPWISSNWMPFVVVGEGGRPL